MTVRFFPSATTLREVRQEYLQAKALPKTWHAIALAKKMARELPASIDAHAVAGARVEEWWQQVKDTLVS